MDGARITGAQYRKVDATDPPGPRLTPYDIGVGTATDPLEDAVWFAAQTPDRQPVVQGEWNVGVVFGKSNAA